MEKKHLTQRKGISSVTCMEALENVWGKDRHMNNFAPLLVTSLTYSHTSSRKFQEILKGTV